MLYLCTVKLINNLQNDKKMDINHTAKKPIRATLKDMAVGDTVSFPTSRTSCVRSTYSVLGLELGRKYKSQLSRESGVIKVIRLK